MERTLIISVALGCLLTACGTIALVPGAEKVRLTQDAKDVSACTPVGNIQMPHNPEGLVVPSPKEFRNQVIGFGGNTGFLTSGSAASPTGGVAYRCP